MIRRYFHNGKAYLFLFLFAVVVYWPVSFMVFSAKGDAINYFLAMRYNTSEALQHNYFPYWSSYINLGYPLHGDIQSGVWNPVVFLMSLFRQYDIYWLHTEIILINFIAGVGMFRLLKYFQFEKKTCLLIAAAYMCNGFITDAGQFLNWLYAAAFLPWVFQYLVRCYRNYSFRDAFALGLSFSLMFLCAYPADSILLAYIILVFVIFSFFKQGKELGWMPAFRKIAGVSAVALISFIIICLPALLSFIEFLPLINRGKGVAIEDAMTNSLAPANLLSLIMPWPTMKGTAFAATDPLIRNCYMGLPVFIFLIAYFFSAIKKDFLQKFLIGIFIVFLLFSFGNVGGLRWIGYKILPLMDSFRHPANAKLFFLFAGQFLAAFAIDKYLKETSSRSGLLKKVTSGLLVLIGIAFITGLIKSNVFPLIKQVFNNTSSLPAVIKQARDELSFYDLLFLNSVLALLICGTTWLLLKKERLRKYFLVLLCLDVFFTAQFMLPLTYVRKASVPYAQSLIENQPKGYPLPDLKTSLAEFSVDGEKYFEIIGCMNPYNKKPGRSDYIITPSNPVWQDEFWEYRSFRERTMSLPLAYFADTIIMIKDSLAFISTPTSSKPALSAIDGINMHSTDSLHSITIKRFDPGKIEFETNSNSEEYFVLLQNDYPRWRVYIDDKISKIYRTNLSFMGTRVPPGKHVIKFRYKTNPLGLLAFLSVIFAFGGMLFYGFTKRNKKIQH